MLESLRTDLQAEIADLLHEEHAVTAYAFQRYLTRADGPLATALAEAEARGRRQGLEEAAKVAETVYKWSPNWNGESVHKAIAGRIRSLATTPAEARESAR